MHIPRRRSRLLVLLSTVVALAATGAVATPDASAVTTCGSKVFQSRHTSWRSGRIWARACAGAEPSIQYGVDSTSHLGLQVTHYVADFWVYRVSDGRMVHHHQCAYTGTTTGDYRSSCGRAPWYTPHKGRSFYTKVRLSYDVLDDGKGAFVIRTGSPVVVA